MNGNLLLPFIFHFQPRVMDCLFLPPPKKVRELGNKNYSYYLRQMYVVLDSS